MTEEDKKILGHGATFLGLLIVCFALLFISAIMTGCNASRSAETTGKAVIITTDTTVINHNSMIKYPKH